MQPSTYEDGNKLASTKRGEWRMIYLCHLTNGHHDTKDWIAAVSIKEMGQLLRKLINLPW
jgi:hypothetical protein